MFLNIGIKKYLLCLIGLLICFQLSAGEKKEELSVANEKLIEKVEVANVYAEKIEIDNREKRIILDFDKNYVPDNVSLKLTLAGGVQMEDPMTLYACYDVRKPVSIRLKKDGKTEVYTISSNYRGDRKYPVVTGPIYDISLLSYGGSQRSVGWNSDECYANVVYTDRKGMKHWLFDTFLFIEGVNGKDRNYSTGFYKPEEDHKHAARKQEWTNLLDTTLCAGKPAHTLDEAVGKAIEELGKPKNRRKVFLTLPVPFKNQKDWGELNGRQLDFTNDSDRVAACRWYIDRAIEMYKNEKFKNIDLAGFYWIAEEHETGKTVIPVINDYIHSLGYKSIWIPYNGPTGSEYWRDMHFDLAFFQPNYAFYKHKPSQEFLLGSLDHARRFNLYMEMEFDELSLKHMRSEYRADRTYDYLNAFEKAGVMHSQPIAYYQSDCCVYYLSLGKYKEDTDLYHTMCGTIARRQQRWGEK